MSSKTSKRTKNIVSHLLIILFGLFMMYPLLWMMSSSFKEATEIFQSQKFFPANFIIKNYVDGWKGMSGYSFGRFLGNSFFIAGVAIVGNVCSCILAAYAFAKVKFPLRNMWFAIMLGTMMLPLHVRLIPTYIVFNSLGWVNTYLPLVVPKFLATEGFFIFLMTQYMRGLPKEMDEAATVDGCGPFRHFLLIIVPLSVPAVITTSIFTFIWTWNDFFSQNIYLSQIGRYTVSMALRQYTDAMGNSSWGALFAMSTISLIPLMTMFIGFQKFLIEGITSGSVKG